jgi:ubiquinone/menaquinone biosynthesis C-methylase UbiE
VVAELRREIGAYYAAGKEQRRLEQGPFKLERARTEEIVLRHLPPPPAEIVDVGGGAGVYALWLAAAGYTVRLVDPVPLHVEQARAESGKHGEGRLAEVLLGDARRLPQADGSHDAVLMLGPLYHLTDRADRLTALREARRVLRPGGGLFAAAIGRFASLLAGLFEGHLLDPAFAAIVQQDLKDGQHRNPTGGFDYFTTAFFHRPEELRAEVLEAGFAVDAVLGIEGPGWLLSDFDTRWADARKRELILAAARAVETEPALLGVSPHLIAVAHRPGQRRTGRNRSKRWAPGRGPADLAPWASRP